MKRTLFFFTLLTIFWTPISYGQTSEDYIKPPVHTIVPASPNASSLGVYGNIPVGHYTGIPEIKIPLYEIETRDFTLPITLSYHASGIKVAQEASTVGLGWTLNAGGCIVREIKHKDDFGYGGYYSDTSFPENNESNNAVNPNAGKFRGYLDKTFDSEPDIFTYNFNNMSGSFFFERDKDSETNTENRAEAIISNKNTWLKIVCYRYNENGYFNRFPRNPFTVYCLSVNVDSDYRCMWISFYHLLPAFPLIMIRFPSLPAFSGSPFSIYSCFAVWT